MSNRTLRIGQLIEETSVSRDEVKRCIDVGLISFERRPNGYRMFGSDATRFLRLYSAREGPPFNFNRPKRCDAINAFSLETLANQKGDALGQWVADQLDQIRQTPSV